MAKFSAKLKKAFSIAEVVIAIAVISIISVGAFTTVTLSIKNQRKNLSYQDVSFTCNSVIDCFRYDSDNLSSTLSTIYGASNVSVDENNSNKISINRTTFTLEIIVNGNTLTLTANDKNDNLLYKNTYNK